jgi:hypothetical protein
MLLARFWALKVCSYFRFGVERDVLCVGGRIWCARFLPRCGSTYPCNGGYLIFVAHPAGKPHHQKIAISWRRGSHLGETVSTGRRQLVDRCAPTQGRLPRLRSKSDAAAHPENKVADDVELPSRRGDPAPTVTSA